MQGGLVLRDGAYRSEQDTFMKVDGVYVTATGRLQAVLKPVDDLKMALEQQDVDLHTPDYRSLLSPYILSNIVMLCI